jgi:hypothetical protein
MNGDGLITAYDRVYSGWALLDDIIDLFGISWGEFVLDNCYDAQFILDNRDLNGVNRASDPAYNLAKHLLAYQLNQGAGAYICPDMIGIETEAVDLLVAIGFDGYGDFLKKTNTPTSKEQASRALELGAILDAYNNNLGCEGLAEMISGVPAPPPPSEPGSDLICSAAVTSEITVFKGSDGEITVTASGGETPYQYKIGTGEYQTNNVFDGLPAGNYAFTVMDNIGSTCTCLATLVQPKNTKAAEIVTGSGVVLLNSELKVYPNPFSDKVVFEFIAAEDVSARLEITNILGQRVVILMDRPVQKGVLNRVEYEPVDVVSQIMIFRLILDDSVQSGRIIYKKE